MYYLLKNNSKILSVWVIGKEKSSNFQPFILKTGIHSLSLVKKMTNKQLKEEDKEELKEEINKIGNIDRARKLDKIEETVRIKTIKQWFL